MARHSVGAKRTQRSCGCCIWVDGKTGEREVVARNHENGVVEYLRRIKALNDAPKPDDFIFAHPDGKPIHSSKRAFASLMRIAGVEFDGVGKKHTIYSLRHTYATMRLTEGVSICAIARNMGTSVAMIERFYGQTRTPDQAAELTKMRDNLNPVGSVLEALDR